MFSYQKNLRGLGAESRSGRKFSAQVICSKSKKTTYAYDLVSGNVKAVHYQTGQADQFHHRYTYDADNRLVTTRTSTDGVLWVMDSKQLYYRHGPVARIELGEKQVQASDYVYTLHGWIKGMNSTVLASGLDPGQDGHAANRPNGNFGRDVAGFALEYYNGDYRAVAASVNTPAGNWQAAVWGAGPYSAALKGLYNGNIAGMQTNVLLPQSTTTSGLQGMAYRYDQLNRIKTTAALRDGTMSAANNVWGAGAVNNGAYAETFSYDLNGNILTATRNGNLTGSQQVMDQFAYRYVRDAAGNIVTNKLGHVDDAVAAANYADDVDDQTANNYVYDAVGNLVSDVREEIQTIDWNQQGKIKSIVRTTGSAKAELVFGYDANGQRAFKQVKPRTGGNLAQEQDWKTTWYVRDAQGNVLAVYEQSDSATGANAFVRRLRVQERHVYGGKRLGLVSENTTVATVNLVNAGGYTSGNAFVGVSFSGRVVVSGPGNKVSRWLGRKRYELGNHLGNVLAVVSDRKRGVDGNADGSVDYYVAEVVSASDYYAFGASMPGRVFVSAGYRYGMNGQEKDNEINNTEGGSYTAEYWQYDSRLGRRWNMDPKPNPSISNYACFANNPIWFTDIDGDTTYKTIFYTYYNYDLPESDPNYMIITERNFAVNSGPGLNYEVYQCYVQTKTINGVKTKIVGGFDISVESGNELRTAMYNDARVDQMNDSRRNAVAGNLDRWEPIHSGEVRFEAKVAYGNTETKAYANFYNRHTETIDGKAGVKVTIASKDYNDSKPGTPEASVTTYVRINNSAPVSDETPVLQFKVPISGYGLVRLNYPITSTGLDFSNPLFIFSPQSVDVGFEKKYGKGPSEAFKIKKPYGTQTIYNNSTKFVF